MKRRRICFGTVFLILLGIEILIALFVHDSFIRPYAGDVLAVMTVYAFVRTLFPDGLRHLPLYVFLFASCVELLQLIDILGLLGLENSRFLSVILGSVFDFEDIVCYLAGCLFLSGYEHAVKKKHDGACGR